MANPEKTAPKQKEPAVEPSVELTPGVLTVLAIAERESEYQGRHGAHAALVAVHLAALDLMRKIDAHADRIDGPAKAALVALRATL